MVASEVAKQAYELCLKALKERLVERANIIQRRLEKENEALAKRQAAFQRSRDTTQGADEEYEKFCVDAMFRIQILEQRLQKHEDTAMSKYEALIKRLQKDPRLASMRDGGVDTSVVAEGEGDGDVGTAVISFFCFKLAALIGFFFYLSLSTDSMT
mgnify:CR=1 FL=1